MSRFSDYMARRRMERTPDEAALAEVFKAHFGRDRLCPTCDGRRWVNADRPGLNPCPDCGATNGS